MESAAELDDLMALDVVDTSVLKHDVVQLLLKHPQGINLGDFSGAFYKLHGHHPQLALHGYSSLKNLLTDMKKVVVLENNSQATVIKLADGVAFNPWLDTGEGWDSSEDGLDSIEEEVESLESGDTEDEADLCGPAASLDMGFSAFNSEPQKMTGRKSVLAAAVVPICSVLRDHPSGLLLQTLTEKLMKRGFDLERFSLDMGHSDTVSCLLEMPGLHLIFLNGLTPNNCVVKLFQSGPGLPPLPKPPSSNSARPSSQPLKERKPGGLTVPAEVLTLLTHLLETYPWGLRIMKLQKKLLTKGFDLEKFSVAQGYGDALEFLQHQMPGLKIEYSENRCKSVVSQGKIRKRKKKKSENVQEEMTTCKSILGNSKVALTSPAKVLALLTRVLKAHKSGLRVQKLEECFMTEKGFDLVKFCVDHGYKDTLEFLECQMPDLSIRYRNKRNKSVVKRGCAGTSKASSRKVTKAGPGATAPLQNGPCSRNPVPPTVIPNRPSLKEQHRASSGAEKSSSPQPRSGTPSQQPSAGPFSGRPAARELSQPTGAQALNKSGLTQPAPPEHLDELKQQVARILAQHPEGMSLFQFRAAYSATYQHHLPLGNASSAKQRLLEMSDIVALKGLGVQTLLFPVASGEPPTKPGLPVFSKVETAAVVLDDPSAKATVRPEPGMVSKISVLKTPMAPQPWTTHPLASGPPRAPDIKENHVLLKGQSSTIPKMVAPSQKPLRPKVSLVAHPPSSEAENAAKNLGYSSTEAAGKMEPVVLVPDPSSLPCLSKIAVARAPSLRSFVPSTLTHLGAPGNKESSFLPESLPPRSIEPSDPLGENAQARAMPRRNRFCPESPVVFTAEPHGSRLRGFSTSDGFAAMSRSLASPPFSVNIPAPPLFQPVLTNVAASQPVVYPPFPRLPGTLANPSLSSPSRRLAPRPLSGTQLQKAELASLPLALPASQNGPARPTPPIQRIEQTADGQNPLQTTSRTRGQDPIRVPGFSAEGPPLQPSSFQHRQSPSVQQLENSHYTLLTSMPCGSVPAPDYGTAASPSVHSKPVVPVCPKQYDTGNDPATSPRIPSSGAPRQPASSSSTDSDCVSSKPLASVPRPYHLSVNPAVTSSNAQQSTLSRSSQGSPISPARQPSYVPFRLDTGYDVSRQSTPLPGISREDSRKDNAYFTLPENQRYRLKEESTPPPTPQKSPPQQRSDNCVLL